MQYFSILMSQLHGIVGSVVILIVRERGDHDVAGNESVMYV
jgi:hypothetical protein